MADVKINNLTINNFTTRNQIVWVDSSTAYFFLTTDGSVYYNKTTDGGATWGSAVDINGSRSSLHFSIWYDQWTSASGSTIHIAYEDTTGDDYYYRSLDTSDDSLGSEVVAFNGFLVSGGRGFSITKARSGYLYMGGMVNSSLGIFYQSTDGGSNWSSKATFTEADRDDKYILLPGAETDSNDIICVFWDQSASVLSLKTYDETADSWSEANIATSMSIPSAGGEVNVGDAISQFSAMHRKSDNHTILAAWSEFDSATADLRVWDITDSSTITEKTQIKTDIDNAGSCGVLVDQTTDDLYVGYVYGTSWKDGSTQTANAYYVKSTDGGTTWDSEVQANESNLSGDIDWVIGATSTDFTPPSVVSYRKGSDWYSTGVSVEEPEELKDIISMGIIPFNR